MTSRVKIFQVTFFTSNFFTFVAAITKVRFLAKRHLRDEPNGSRALSENI